MIMKLGLETQSLGFDIGISNQRKQGINKL